MTELIKDKSLTYQEIWDRLRVAQADLTKMINEEKEKENENK